jgi:hypothetical protein
MDANNYDTRLEILEKYIRSLLRNEFMYYQFWTLVENDTDYEIGVRNETTQRRTVVRISKDKLSSLKTEALVVQCIEQSLSKAIYRI